MPAIGVQRLQTKLGLMSAYSPRVRKQLQSTKEVNVMAGQKNGRPLKTVDCYLLDLVPLYFHNVYTSLSEYESLRQSNMTIPFTHNLAFNSNE